MKPFKQLRGRTILLSVPERKKSALELSAKDEEAMMQEAAKMWSRLTVYAIGDKVEDVKEGDEVYVRTSSLNMETVERVDIDGAIKLVLNEGDVIIVW
jgi:histidinol phosphatase-like enzyme